MCIYVKLEGLGVDVVYLHNTETLEFCQYGYKIWMA